MKKFLVVSLILIVLLFGENIFEAAIKFCPPLLIFIFAAAFIADRNCLANIIGGGCLIPIGIIAFIAWLIWLFG